ncbi:MAG: serine protein kinase RIO [Candidatus Undinarchaeales archaeon]|jgi:RIO kinase 1|nr:serine protein kinase RIO [Candidatus Undinarchaeales archaeon]
MAIDKRTKKIERKLEDGVFDVNTMNVLHKLMRQGHLDKIGGPIAVGKEANVYRAYLGEEKLAVKIYRIETSSFKKMMPYLEGDPRFDVRQAKYDLILVWAKKEFQNLKRAFKASVPCPKPIAVMKNVLVMSFIGNEQPASELHDYIPEDLQTVYNGVVDALHNLYKSAGLVHGDMSEFNILIKDEKPVLIDFGQSMLKEHFRGEELLNRDCEVLARFFKKHGIEIDDLKIKNAITKA